ncbi:hypothetical protein EYC54_00665 [Xanthomonas oryzae]|uniref:hypothetical protein n=1 Tax=Xanthomonas oryzae TaxID=347 RepID=UPI001034B6A8|nr:hypothetical protein [Xanthomonas oryzae]QBG86567.1 hypothetical protein EYC54_00665 [Xanthomonas oryzae]
MKPELKLDSAPLLEPTCPYRRATYFQMGPRPSGICTVGDQRASFAAISLVAGDKAFASIYIFDLSTTNLTSLRAGLELIARPVDRMDPIRYPETLRRQGSYHVTDAVYMRGEELWIISHQTDGAKAGDYQLVHVRRPWLDFSLADLNSCMALPE